MFLKDINNTLPWNVLIFYALRNNSIFRKPLEHWFVPLNTSFSCFKKNLSIHTCMNPSVWIYDQPLKSTSLQWENRLANSDLSVYILYGFNKDNEVF